MSESYIVQPPSSRRGWWRIRLEAQDGVHRQLGEAVAYARDGAAATMVASALNAARAELEAFPPSDPLEAEPPSQPSREVHR